MTLKLDQGKQTLPQSKTRNRSSERRHVSWTNLQQGKNIVRSAKEDTLRTSYEIIDQKIPELYDEALQPDLFTSQ